MGMSSIAQAVPRVAESLLERAELRDLVERCLPVSDAGRWKPAPEAYAYAVRCCGVEPVDAALVAVHPWDIDGAGRAGMRTGWLARDGGAYPSFFRAPELSARSSGARGRAHHEPLVMLSEASAGRREVVVDGTRLSYLHAGSGKPVLLLHGTFWSRVWEPILAAVAATGHQVLALDFPGFGLSDGRLMRDEAAVPALAACALRFLEALGIAGPLVVGGHDVGGAVAQHLAAHESRVEALVLMNSVLYDSWPVPAVERFRDQAVADAVTVEELLEARAQSLAKAVARPLDDSERAAWLAPWHSEDRVRSWTAMAGVADAHYTLDLTERLRERALPTLLAWGEQDEFQPIQFAARYAREVPGARLERIPGARHIPTVDEPGRVAAALAGHLEDRPP